MFCEKNKLAPKHRSAKVLMRPRENTPEGEPVWDWTQANIDLLFGPNCPFDLDQYKSASGWYSHTELNEGKSMRAEEFVDKFYESEELVQRVREKLRIRGFGFAFETDYDRVQADADKEDVT